jgi:hypothetical protein
VANETMPYIAVIGGLWQLTGEQLLASKKYAEQIGAELAKGGFRLVVYNSEERSLEPYVVSGFVAATSNGGAGGSICVRCAQSQRTSVNFAEETSRGNLFDRRYFPTQDWEVPFYRSLVDAEGVDGVIVMAGARSTLVAAQIAIARQLPLLAFEQFDGSAAVIWTELAARIKGYPSAADTPAKAIAWLKVQCQEQTAGRQQIQQREKTYLRTRSQLAKTAWASGAFLALLIAVLLGLSRSPDPEYYTWVTLAGLIAAGATGALIRSLMWGTEDDNSATSLFFGAVAGFVVGLAYLIPQWVGAPGVLNATSGNVQATDKIQFVSALLVAISAGVGFDTVFTRLKKEAETHSIGARP